MVNYSFAAITVFIFLLDHSLAFSRPLALLDHGCAIAIVVMSLTNRHACSDRSSTDT
jgi:hypothetical protein